MALVAELQLVAEAVEAASTCSVVVAVEVVAFAALRRLEVAAVAVGVHQWLVVEALMQRRVEPREHQRQLVESLKVQRREVHPGLARLMRRVVAWSINKMCI